MAQTRVDPGDPLLLRAVEILRQRVAAGEADRALCARMLPALAAGELRLPMIPATLARVLELAQQEEVDLDELAFAVEMDPALATQVVGVANSAWFRGREVALAVRPALLRMGLREARQVVVAVGLGSGAFRIPGMERHASALWHHAALSALACQALLEEQPPWDETGFLAGLVHDVGRLALLAFAAPVRGRRPPSDEALAAAGDALHVTLGTLVVRAWGFPDVFVAAVGSHHEPQSCGGPDNLLAWGLYAADTLANLYERGWRPGSCEENDARVRELLGPLGIDLERCGQILVELEGGLSALTKLA